VKKQAASQYLVGGRTLSGQSALESRVKKYANSLFIMHITRTGSDSTRIALENVDLSDV
jgi:hypothetical protein